MSDPSNSNATPSNDGASVGAVPVDAGAAAGEASANGGAAPADPKRSARAKLAAHPKVKQAISLAKEHPLGAVATVAAAAALLEIEFAVGIITGLGATALLAKKSGPEARDEVIARGKLAIARARVALAKRRNARRAQPASAEAAPPPAE